MRWSPYGRQLPLTEFEGGMNAQLILGPEGTPPMGLRLVRSPGAVHFDRLYIDLNRDGEYSDTELHETTVTESNYKYWSSFDAVVEVPAVDPETRDGIMNPYPLGLWFVEDPRVQDEEPVIRFSRHGWMEGTVALDGVEAVMLVTEAVMDGVFGTGDSWALASRDSAPDILTPSYSRSLDEHAWLFDKAYRVTAIDPSGRRLVLVPFDPGMTRAEEMEMNDDLAVDRRAARSGRTVAFLHDFTEAERLARTEGKALFVDFETTWCGPCKIMDEWVYTADDVVDASQAVVAVKVDGDERLDLKERFGVSGFPTVILLSPQGEELRRASGYVNVVDMTEFLKGPH
jgi:thiol-disulfide isomerase/thioredoxin